MRSSGHEAETAGIWARPLSDRRPDVPWAPLEGRDPVGSASQMSNPLRTTAGEAPGPEFCDDRVPNQIRLYACFRVRAVLPNCGSPYRRQARLAHLLRFGSGRRCEEPLRTECPAQGVRLAAKRQAAGSAPSRNEEASGIPPARRRRFRGDIGRLRGWAAGALKGFRVLKIKRTHHAAPRGVVLPGRGHSASGSSERGYIRDGKA
jgi:hypothetical protein